MSQAAPSGHAIRPVIDTRTPRVDLDLLNVAAMLLSCGLAYVAPFELVLASYAFLGPAHYLTQISWMHDREYFAGTPWLWLPLSVVSVAIVLSGTTAAAAMLVTVLAGCVALVLFRAWWPRVALTAASLAAFLATTDVLPALPLAVAMLIPSLLHIYVFTGAFILSGALRSSSRRGLASFGVFIACGGAFFVIAPQERLLLPALSAGNVDFFARLARYLVDLFSFGGRVEPTAMMGLLSFAYTYHYLNWFTKVRVIRWADVRPERMAALSALYVASVSLYLISFRAGFFALMILSLLHVLLEFPLDALTFKGLLARVRPGAPLRTRHG